MDMVAILRYVFDHNQQVIAGLVVVILVTAILLFLRALGQDKGHVSGRAGATADLDIGAIEAAFKRVVAASGGVVAGAATTAAGGAAGADNAAGEDAAQNAKVQDLAREIDRLTSELATKSAGGAAGTSSGVDPDKVAELQAKIEELQGKLAEYEIIEDDIADLSRFKEENSELRKELEQLKQNAGAMAAAPAAVAAPEEAAAPPEAAAPQAPAPASLAAEDSSEAVMQDIAAAMEVRDPAEASVLDASLDTEKMISEVSDLAASNVTDEDDALVGALDTDKLLAEVDTLAPGAAAAAAAGVAEAAPAPVVTPPPQAAAPANAIAPEDDLLAEFKETNDGGQG